MSIYSYSLIACALIDFTLCFVAWYKRPVQKVYRFAVFLILAFGMWALGDFFISLVNTQAEAAFWTKFSLTWRFFTGPLFLMFMLELARVLKVWERKIPYLWIALPAALIAAVNMFTDWVVPEVFPGPWGWMHALNYTYLFFEGYSFVFMVCSMTLAVLCVRKLAKKKLTVWLGAALGLTLLSFYAYSSFFEWYHPFIGVFEAPSYGPYLYTIISLLCYMFFNRYGFVEITPEVAADKLAETMPDALMVFEQDGRILLNNEESARVLGYGQDEFRNKNAFALLSLKKDKFNRSIVPDLAKDRNVTDFDVFARGKDGKRRHLSFSFAPLKDNFGRLVGIIGVGKDMTERDKMAEELQKYRQSLEKAVQEKTEELKVKVDQLEDTRMAVLNVLEDVRVERDRAEAERNRAEILLESIGDGVFAVDRNDRIVLFNKQAERLIGMDADKAVGKDYREVVRFYAEGKKPELNLGFISEAAEKKAAVKIGGKNVLRRADNEETDIDSVASPVLRQDGSVRGVVVVFRDVSEERTIERMKTEFVSVASHQLRTPLSGVKWFLEMLLSGDAGKLSDQQQEFVQEAFDSNDRMINLVNDLLNVSRLETGRIVPEIRKVDPAKLIQELIAERDAMIKARNARVKFKKGRGDYRLESDPSLLKQVVGNLLDNAVKYSDRTESEVEISLEKAAPDKVKITVRDNGIGIPKDKQYMIFSKFFRAENATRMETEGSGLGLYISQLIVESFGGRIWFKSPLHSRSKKKGTAFYVVLPTKAPSK